MIVAITPTEIRTARESAGLTQQQAATVVHVGTNTWRHWEAGRSPIHPGLWELFLIKTGKIPIDSTV